MTAEILNSATDHPLRLIVDFMRAVEPGTNTGVRRREIVLASVYAWLAKGGDTTVGLIALAAAFSPRFMWSELDPGVGSQVTFHFGILLPNERRRLESHWPEALVVLRNLDIKDWGPLRNLVFEWAYPEQQGIRLLPETAVPMYDFAGGMLRDLVSISDGRPEVATGRNHSQSILESNSRSMSIPTSKPFTRRVK